MVEREPFNRPTFAYVLLTILASFLIPSTQLTRLRRWVLFIPFAAMCLSLVRFTTTNDAQADLGIGAVILTLLMVGADSILITDVQNELKRTFGHQPKDMGQASWKERIWWATILFMSPRGVGWSHEPLFLKERGIKLQKAHEGPWPFVFYNLIWSVVSLSLDHGGTLLLQHIPAFSSSDTVCGRTPGARLSMWDCGIPSGVLGAVCFATTTFARIQLLHSFMSALAVGGWGSDVRGWPGIFGDPRESWSVQRFWGRTWHQLIRRSLPQCTNFVTSTVFRCPRRRESKAPALLWLFTAFFLTGIVHGGGEYMMLKGQNGGGRGALVFFMLQAVAITLEKGIFSLVGWCWDAQTVKTQEPSKDSSRWKPNQTGKALGYIWVGVWFAWSIQFFIDPMISAGVFDNHERS